MNMYEEDKQALLTGAAKVFSRISVVGTEVVFTEDDYIGDWTYEDFRYVPDTGFLGQFVERLFDCNLLGVPLNVDLTNAEINVQFGIMATPNAPIHWYDYGNFIVTKKEYNDTEDTTVIECSDYTKLFNTNFVDDPDMYPCTLLELENKVCTDVDIPLDSTGVAYIYKVKQDETLPIGTYEIKVGDDYYSFTTTDILNPRDTIMLIIEDNTPRLIQKHITYDANLVPTNNRTELQLTSSQTSSYTELEVNSVNYCDYINNDFVLFGNPFDEPTTNRDVIKYISATAFNWARINESNRLCHDFTVKSTTDVGDYDEITPDEYENSKIIGSTILPVNKVVIGLKNIEGERVYKTSQDYTEETESSIAIYDNPITYDTETRLIALADCNNLFGLTYTPVNINSVGHPWLKGDDFIKFTNIDNTIVYSYPFNRTHTYTGVMETNLTSDSKSSSVGGVEYKDDTGAKLRQTQYVVDKMNGQIIQLVQESDDTQSRLAQTIMDVQKINNIFQLQGGNNLIKNSAFLLTDAVWDFEELVQDLGEHTELGKSYTTNYLGTVISNAEIMLKNTKMTSKTDLNNILITQLNDAHTFSFKYRMDAFTSATVKLINPNDNSIVWQTTLTPTNNITEVVSSSENPIIPRYNNLVLEVSTTTTNDGALYLYDLLLNIGEKQTWSPASDELYSTYIRLSQLGLTIYSNGGGVATVISSDEFAIFKASLSSDNIELGDKVTDFSDDGIDTTNIKSTSVATGKYVMEDRNWGGVEHHIEYFKDN